MDDAVEVNGRAEDNQLCFYAATILSLSETEAEVRYGDLKTEDNRPVIENVGLQYLRPKPVHFSFDYKMGDAVNVWVKDRWWLGRFKARVGRSEAVCLIYKPGRQEIVYCKRKHVRAHFIWQLIEDLSVWSFTQLIRDPIDHGSGEEDA